MPFGLKFHREHRFLGYKVKYLYYLIARREILQKVKSFGARNPDKTIYVIKPDYQDGVEGLLSLVFKQVLYINYAKQKGYIPFVDWKNFKTQYCDGENNVWDYFFQPVSHLTEEDVYNSKKVLFSGWTFNDINPNGIFEAEIFDDKLLEKQSCELLKENLVFNREIEEWVNKEAQLLDIENCIGVYIRGTDYVKLRPSGEYVQPSIEQVKNKIDEFIHKYEADIYLVTEDGNIYDEIKTKYEGKIRIISCDSFIRNYDGTKVLSKSGVLDDNKKLRGQKYLVKMILLSKCKYLISSITQGSKFSFALNGGQYKDSFIFNLGLYS